jgi:hypothetical protein
MHPKRMLINSYQNRHPNTFYKNLLSLRLTELYESLFISGNGIKTPYPYLQVYKMWLVTYLIDLGMVDLAMKYLEHLSNFIKGCEPNNPSVPPILRRQLQEFTDRLIVCCSMTINKKQQESGGWFGKLSNNLSGAAIGRGIEHLMNSAVGVEETSNASTNSKRKTLFPMPGENVEYVSSPSVGMAKMNSLGRASDVPPSNSSTYAQSESGKSNAVNSNQLGQYQAGVPFNENSSSSYPAYGNSQDSMQTYSSPNLSPSMKVQQPPPPAIPFQPPQPVVAPSVVPLMGNGTVPVAAPVLPIPPMETQPIPQTAPQQTQEEDLGFGNSSFQKPPPIESQQGTTAREEKQSKVDKKPDEKGPSSLI